MNTYLLEYLFLKFQQFWSISLAMTILVFFGRFHSYETNETISKSDLEVILIISVIGVVFSSYFNYLALCCHV